MDSETFKVLEKWAADEFRSVNGQIEYLLHKSIVEAGRGKHTDSAGKSSFVAEKKRNPQ